MDFHFYHHIGAETMEFLQKTGVPGLTDRLDKIQETLNIMTEAERIISEKLDASDIAREASQQRALDAIAVANEALAFVKQQNVALTTLVEELRANQPDLTDEAERIQTQIDDANAFLARTDPETSGEETSAV